jgi:arginyl-tRNA synthetase
MNVFAHVDGLIRSALQALQDEGAVPKELALNGLDTQEPRDPAHGDLASNAAMALAKAAGQRPRDLALLLADKLRTHPDIAKVEVAGPGFLNLTLVPDYWHRLVRTILADASYGRSALGKGQRLNVEYVSANPTGPMHVGHCRGAVFGDALSNLLAFAGYEVTREYYINDAGAQVDKLGQATLLRAREALGDDIGAIPEGLYPGDYLKPIGAALAEKYGRELFQRPEAEQVAIARDWAIATLLAEIKDDLAQLNVRHDVYFSERSLTSGPRDKIAAAIDVLRGKGLIYEGRLPRPKGHDDDEWEDREQTLFRSTDFGDDIDRALKKSDGSYTYFAGDVGYHLDKVERKFDQYFNVLGADHVGYIPRLKAIVSALSGGAARYDTPVCQLVKVLRNGVPIRMSKRAGTFVALRDVVDEVGRDPVRFMMLTRKNDSPLDFDLAKVVEQSKDNPVFYVQYAHARAASVFRNAAEAFPQLNREAVSAPGIDLSRLTDPGELDLIKRLARFPRLIEGAARDREPHRLTFYLFDLASAFHQQWTRGNESPHLRFIQLGDGGVTGARLALVAATQRVLSLGLDVLGVRAPDEMR